MENVISVYKIVDYGEQTNNNTEYMRQLYMIQTNI